GRGDLVVQRGALGAMGVVAIQVLQPALAGAGRRRRGGRTRRIEQRRLVAARRRVGEDEGVGPRRRALAFVPVEPPVDVDLAVGRADGPRRVGVRPGRVGDVDGGHVVLQQARRARHADAVDGAVSVQHDLELGHQVAVVERARAGLVIPLLELAEAPQLVNAPVHARDVGRERRRARVEGGLVPRVNLGDEVLDGRTHARQLLLELPLPRRLGLLGQAPLGVGRRAEQVLVVLARQRQLHLLAVGDLRRVALVPAVGPRRQRNLAVRGVRQRQVGGLGRQLVMLGRRVAQREQRLADLLVVVGRRRDLRVLVGRHVRRLTPQQRLLILELRELFFLGAGVVVLSLRRRARRLLPLLVLQQVRVFGARLLLDAVVLLGQELRVGRRRDLLVGVHVDHLLVRLPLGRRRWRRRRHGRQRRHHHLGLRLLRLRRLLLGLGFELLDLLLVDLGLLLRLLRLLGSGQRLRGRIDGRQVVRQRGLVGGLERDVHLLGALALFPSAVHPGRDHQRGDGVEVQQQRNQRAAREMTARAFALPLLHPSA